MSVENNNFMTTITKNPLVSLIVVVVIILIIVLIVKMRGSEEAFSSHSKDEHIVENFPQSTPMNVMYSDANGNLGTTTDLGLQNLTIGKEGALLLGNKFRFNANKDAHADDEWLRMMNPENTGYSGGFAAGKLYGGSVVHSDGTMYSRGDITAGGTITAAGTISAGGTITAGGDINTGKNINMPAGSIIKSPGTMHISTNSERLYLLPKDGVYITNDWGGTGNLTVTGTTSVGGDLSAKSVNTGSVNIYNYGDMKTKMEELFARVKTLEDNAVMYNKPVLTLANNGPMIGKTSRPGNAGYYSGNLDQFMGFGSCDECGGGADKFKLWPGAANTTSFKFVKSYP